MKLSEAIMMNGMTKPQGFGPDSFRSKDAPCALGGALQAVGAKQDYQRLWDLWPWTFNKSERPSKCCPCPECAAVLIHPSDTIWHLNDTHEWTRSQIAEWVATIEPQDEPTASLTAPLETALPVQG